jgi:hypothetical protein
VQTLKSHHYDKAFNTARILGEIMLTIDEAIGRFESLSPDDKVRVLGLVSYHFTIAGRDVSTQGDCQQQRDRLVALNEIQHKLVAQILALLKNRSDRYPDKDFFLVLVDMSKRAGMLPYLQGAFVKVL